MGQRSRRRGLSGAAVRAARAAGRERDEAAAATAQRVYNAIVEARASGESGDVSPVLWGPLTVACEIVAQVVVKAEGMPGDEETLVDVAAYFAAGFIAGGQRFDREHFEAWRVIGETPETTEA